MIDKVIGAGRFSANSASGLFTPTSSSTIAIIGPVTGVCKATALRSQAGRSPSRGVGTMLGCGLLGTAGTVSPGEDARIGWAWGDWTGIDWGGVDCAVFETGGADSTGVVIGAGTGAPCGTVDACESEMAGAA